MMRIKNPSCRATHVRWDLAVGVKGNGKPFVSWTAGSAAERSYPGRHNGPAKTLCPTSWLLEKRPVRAILRGRSWLISGNIPLPSTPTHIIELSWQKLVSLNRPHPRDRDRNDFEGEGPTPRVNREKRHGAKGGSMLSLLNT